MASDKYPVKDFHSVSEDVWGVEFEDGVILLCTKAATRNEKHVDTMIAQHTKDGDPDEAERMKAMIVAVRAHEAAT